VRIAANFVAPVMWMETMMGVGFTPTHYIDVTPHMDLKREAIRRHVSQDTERFIDMAELGGRFRAAQCNVPTGYAEAFRFEPIFPFADPRNLLPPAPGVTPVRDRRTAGQGSPLSSVPLVRCRSQAPLSSPPLRGEEAPSFRCGQATSPPRPLRERKAAQALQRRSRAEERGRRSQYGLITNSRD
jgi:hypothetical protein